MRVRILQAIGFLCIETFIIIYWMGMWSLFQLTPLLGYAGFNVFLLVFGATGLFVVNAFSAHFIMNTINNSTEVVRATFPTPQNARNIVRVIRLPK